VTAKHRERIAALEHELQPDDPIKYPIHERYDRQSEKARR